MASRSWNRVELIGNLTRDPELRYTPNGAAVATFSIATNRTYVSDGEKKEEVDFHRCVAWNKLAELCEQLLKKGNRIFVSGRLQNRSWEGTDGQNRQVTEIVVEDMLLLTSRSDSSSANEDVSPAGVPESFSEPAAEKGGEDFPVSKNKEPESPKSEDTKESQEKSEEEEKPKKAKQEKEDIDIDDLPF